MVERERAFKPVLSQPASGEKSASVIDQDIDGRFLVCDLRSNTFHLGQACEIGKDAAWSSLSAPLGSRASVAFARDLFRATRTIRAPVPARALAATSPIPDVPPVITTVLLCISTLVRPE